MPEIPRSLGPQVRTAPLPAPLANPGMASPDAFGAAIGEGLGRGGVMALRAQQQAEEDRDDIEAADALNQFAELDHKKMAEFRSRTGGNARGVLDEAGEDYKKRQEEFSKKLTRPGAQQRFREMTDARWANRNSAIITEHQVEQLRRYEADTLDGLVKTTQLDALDVGTDEALIEADRRAALTLERRLDLDGADPQTRDLTLRANRDTLVGAFIEQDIAADNWKGAKARLDKFGDTMSKGKRATLEAKVREGGLNQQAQDTADLITGAPDMTKADMDKAVASLKEDADLRQRTQVKVDQEWARRESAIREARVAAVDEIAKEVQAGADPVNVLAKHENRAALTAQDVEELHGLAARVASRNEPQPNGERWQELLNEASADPRAFMARNFRMELGKITRREYEEFARHKAAMIAGTLKKDATDPIPQGIFSANDIANNAMREVGMNPEVKDGKQDPAALAFKRQFNKAIIAKGGHTKLTEPDMEKIAAGLLVKHQIQKKGFLGRDYSVEIPRFQLPGMDKAAFSPDQVPDNYRKEIDDALIKRGKPAGSLQGDAYMQAYEKLLERDALKEAAKPAVRTLEQTDPFAMGGL